MTFDEILERFRHGSELRGGEVLLSPGYALKVVSLCDRNELAVIGIESFRLSNDETEPLLDLIADCSQAVSSDWGTYRTAANNCARSFLAQLPPMPSLYLSLVGIGDPGVRSQGVSSPM
jgi:hypothetical protein